MNKLMAKLASNVLDRIAIYFVKTASPHVHRPEIPEELKK